MYARIYIYIIICITFDIKGWGRKEFSSRCSAAGQPHHQRFARLCSSRVMWCWMYPNTLLYSILAPPQTKTLYDDFYSEKCTGNYVDFFALLVSCKFSSECCGCSFLGFKYMWDKVALFPFALQSLICPSRTSDTLLLAIVAWACGLLCGAAGATLILSPSLRRFLVRGLFFALQESQPAPAFTDRLRRYRQ